MAELAAAMSVPGAFATLKISCPCCAPLLLDDDDDYVAPQLDELPPELATALVFDSHCHTVAAADGRYAGITQATEEANWPTVLAACASRRLRPGLGVHPWQAHWSTTSTRSSDASRPIWRNTRRRSSGRSVCASARKM